MASSSDAWSFGAGIVKFFETIRAKVEAKMVKPTELVTITVQDIQRRTVTRTMRRTDGLQGLMDYYYEVVFPAGAGRREGRFLFDGRRVKGEHTPEDLNMVDGDIIDFFLDMSGG